MDEPHVEKSLPASYHLQLAESCEEAAQLLAQQRVRCTDFVRRRVICEKIEQHLRTAKFHRRMADEATS